MYQKYVNVSKEKCAREKELYRIYYTQKYDSSIRFSLQQIKRWPMVFKMIGVLQFMGRFIFAWLSFPIRFYTTDVFSVYHMKNIAFELFN